MKRAFLQHIDTQSLKLGSRWIRVLPLALVIAGFSMVQPAPAQERTLRTLSVTGQGIEMIETTLAQVSLGVEVEAETAVEAQREAARRSDAVVSFLRSRDVEQLQTTGINLSPRYNYSNDERQLVGYTASNVVSFRVPVDQAGRLLDDVVQAGATRIDGISFTAEEEAIAAAQLRALQEATEDAREQADAVFDALGFSAGEIVGIQINNASLPPTPMFDVRAASLEQSATTPVVGGEQRVNAAVTLQIAY